MSDYKKCHGKGGQSGNQQGQGQGERDSGQKKGSPKGQPGRLRADSGRLQVTVVSEAEHAEMIARHAGKPCV